MGLTHNICKENFWVALPNMFEVRWRTGIKKEHFKLLILGGHSLAAGQI